MRIPEDLLHTLARSCFAALISACLLGCDVEKNVTFSLEPIETGSDMLIVSVSILDQEQAWISGSNSTLMRTGDGGASWDIFHHPDIDTFQFRDVHAFSFSEVILLAIGDGANSQIHKFSTSEGWTRVFVMDESEGFSQQHCFLGW